MEDRVVRANGTVGMPNVLFVDIDVRHGVALSQLFAG
jgi:hypothetical protein